MQAAAPDFLVATVIMRSLTGEAHEPFAYAQKEAQKSKAEVVAASSSGKRYAIRGGRQRKRRSSGERAVAIPAHAPAAAAENARLEARLLFRRYRMCVRTWRERCAVRLHLPRGKSDAAR